MIRNEIKEKQRFLANPGTWLYRYILNHKNRVEDLKMDYNQRMFDEHHFFDEGLQTAKTWAIEAGLMSEEDHIFDMVTEPEDE